METETLQKIKDCLGGKFVDVKDIRLLKSKLKEVQKSISDIFSNRTSFEEIRWLLKANLLFMNYKIYVHTCTEKDPRREPSPKNNQNKFSFPYLESITLSDEAMLFLSEKLDE